MSNIVFSNSQNDPALPVQEQYTSLGDAIQNGDLEGVKRLMEKENGIPWGYGAALVRAAKEGHYEIVQYLTEFKDKSLPEYKHTYKDVLIAEVLRKRGDIYYAQEALDEAVKNGRFDIVKYFIKQRIKKFPQVLRQAVKAGNLEMVKDLVEHIGNLTRIKKGALDEAAYKAVLKGDLTILKYLVEQGANINVSHQNADSGTVQENPLSAASRLGNLEIAQYLVDQGANIHAHDEIALKKAVSNGNLEIVKYLVSRGADIHTQNEAILQIAILGGNLETVKYLVGQGVDIHAWKEVALITASRLGDLEIVKYLVEQGADIHAQDEQALKYACSKRHLAIVKYLANRGQGRRIINF